ncbi:MAG: YgiQ family radical SAM protein [bacterium]|nr:YgiQ family radical SAM protein [bacterium]
MSRSVLPQPPFLPMSRTEMHKLGWSELDVLLVSGDAYVDHPSFAMALLGRFLIAHGYRTGLVCQPRWNSTEDFLVMGRPRLLVGVGAGALDSMLAHYTAFRKKRHDDAFTPGGRCGARPNRAVIVYTNLAHQAFPGLPVAIGGIEASLRRYVHYDFWSDSLRRPILMDSKADVLIYGMGEYALLGLLKRLEEAQERNQPPNFLGLNGTACMANETDLAHYSDAIQLPSHEEILQDPRLLVKSALMAEQHLQEGCRTCLQRVGNRYVVVAPPQPLLTSKQLDAIYDLPFSRTAHPIYREPIPALEMIRTSINSHRGCGGGCSFCSLALHQGRPIASRSASSILRELEQITSAPQFKGSISDIGGPTANMWQARCKADSSKCKRSSCLFPSVCPNFAANQTGYVELLRQALHHKKVKHVRIASGIRFDLALKDRTACQAYIAEFTGGQLKIAPEHCVPHVLQLMRKPSIELMNKFVDCFYQYSREAQKEQYVIPYLMSAFPGCSEQDMHDLAKWLKKRGWSPQQVQCFIPTPGTVATAMYYAETDPQGNPIHVAKSDAERLRQHHILLGDKVDKSNRETEAKNSSDGGCLNRKQGRANSGSNYSNLRKSDANLSGKSTKGAKPSRGPDWGNRDNKNGRRYGRRPAK